MVALASQLERNSRQISQLAGQLPGVAQAHFLNSLLLDEITYTNEIEGIKTDAAEISTIINSLDDGLRAREKRLWSTVRMYQEASRGKLLSITALQDFRDIYDELLKGEIPLEKSLMGSCLEILCQMGKLCGSGMRLKPFTCRQRRNWQFQKP